MAIGTGDIIMEGMKTAAELTKERRDSYLAALVRELDGYKARLNGLKSEGRTDAADMIKTLEQQIKDVEAELRAHGDDREPRSKIAK